MERKHKYLFETTRSLLFQSKLPIKYWGGCIMTTTSIITKLPSHDFHNKCPVGLLLQQQPSYSHMIRLGCLSYPSTPKIHRTKFDPKNNHHVFIGYPLNTKGWKVLKLDCKKIHVSWDVVFHETVVPFLLAKDTITILASLIFLFISWSCISFCHLQYPS